MKDIITYLKQIEVDIHLLHEEIVELKRRVAYLENECSINDGR